MYVRMAIVLRGDTVFLKIQIHCRLLLKSHGRKLHVHTKDLYVGDKALHAS